MRIVALADGFDISLDGSLVPLLRHPVTDMTVVDSLLATFSDCDINMVVGYRAPELLSAYPGLRYIYNEKWPETNSAYSLALALEACPTLVLPLNTYADQRLAAFAELPYPDIALCSVDENRASGSINAVLTDTALAEIYSGSLRNILDPELIGIYRISTPEILAEWRQRGLKYPHLTYNQTLPIADTLPPILCQAQPREDQITRIRCIGDYLRLWEAKDD